MDWTQIDITKMLYVILAFAASTWTALMLVFGVWLGARLMQRKTGDRTPLLASEPEVPDILGDIITQTN